MPTPAVNHYDYLSRRLASLTEQREAAKIKVLTCEFDIEHARRSFEEEWKEGSNSWRYGQAGQQRKEKWEETDRELRRSMRGFSEHETGLEQLIQEINHQLSMYRYR